MALKKIIIILSGLFALWAYAKLCLLLDENCKGQLNFLINIFGSDEFGRDTFAVAILSSLNSMAVAIMLSAFSFCIALVIAFGAFLSRIDYLKLFLNSIGTLIESCPVIIWLFVIIVGLRNEPRIIIVTVAFVLAAIPYLSNVIYGELERLWHADFVESARIAGLGEWRIGLRFIMPNTLAVITPVLVNLYGAALTINGVIGVLGMGNRMDLEIGVLLLRGKENISNQPQIMFLAICGLLLIFWIMIILIQEIKKIVEGDKRVVFRNTIF